ncbi:MAG: hypothetical protein A3J81_06355 [Nitrospirae bacterium RIFOXYB2_FULL_43_5]|nr:MAG: hypothetical protein A2X54_06010 [Nitrospirae bacterium GWF2_44_13]OGW66222.1 MAG: hypothetical protein A2222_07810 [Nitrospirae bacterium RIFOXYA2_FULL_44_9]OGW73123.1 MAG: hypothetical protein A3J81_06355 [Nitrospirae bacterium RIFOXYB2_FULL_43_5]OGW73844.1 MAG: hypothetical protein A2484_05495 [Nitrospirae bacterium RIFOXYC2_FULL_44_7]HBG92287.1 hypothetical protein [Nitrospiraceae bacterium]
MQLQLRNTEVRSKVGLIVPFNFGKRPAVSVSRPESKQAKSIAEAVILQSMEDIYERGHMRESIEFFNGSGFELCAEIAGLTEREKTEILNIVRGAGFEVASAIPQLI